LGENSPLVIHEAQACHIPVITADFGGMSEYVRHLENGLLFQHRNVQDLAQKIQFAVENPALMQKLGQKGYLYSADGQVPSIEDHCKTLEQIYNKLINQNATQYLAYHD
jgi:glycosyltransferase involved in cell wall biosynthesis